MIETELCAYTLTAVEAARRAGATRVELCASPYEGGTTPSAGVIRLARAVEGLQLSVMIRPRGGDFLYSDSEFRQMIEDVRFARSCGADGVVVGLLLPDGSIDRQRTAQLVEEAGDLCVTFHRAFDMARDPEEALEEVIAAGCRRILTSGGRQTAMEGIDTLRMLVAQAAGRIDLMAGSGVSAANALTLAQTGVDAIHFSARCMRPSGMTWRNPAISMGSTPGIPEYESFDADEDKIKEIIRTLQ